MKKINSTPAKTSIMWACFFSVNLRSSSYVREFRILNCFYPPQEKNILKRLLVYAVVFSKRAPPTVAISFLKEDAFFCPFQSKNSHQFTLQKRNYRVFSFSCSWQERGCVVFYGEGAFFMWVTMKYLDELLSVTWLPYWIVYFLMVPLEDRAAEIWGKLSFLSHSHPEWWHCPVLLFLFTSAGGKEDVLTCATVEHITNARDWIKISYEGRESLKCCSCKQADPVKRWTPGCRRS